MICEICGRLYVASCIRCTKRVMTWGENGTCELIRLAKSNEDIKANYLLWFCKTYYRGKTNIRESVHTLKTSLRLLGYKGKFIGRIHKNKEDYFSIRMREISAGIR